MTTADQIGSNPVVWVQRLRLVSKDSDFTPAQKKVIEEQLLTLQRELDSK